VDFPGRPCRLPGYDYSLSGPVFHCRFAVARRVAAFTDARAAKIVVDALRYHHETTAHVLAFCVMPDHVHVLLSLRSQARSLSRWVGDVKRWVTRQTAEHGLGLVWQKGFFERVLRSNEDVLITARYIVENPVRAGLIIDARDYEWGGSFEWNLWEKRKE
jgi:putative transposase